MRNSQYNSETSLHQIYSHLGLDINPNKTEVIQTAFKWHDLAAWMHVDVPLSNINSFIYLGSIISDNGHINEDILWQINLASASFGRLHLWVFSNSNLTHHQSGYRTVVISTQLYGYECWNLYHWQIKLLEKFHIYYLRWNLHVTWRDKIPHSKILQHVEIVSIEAIIQKHLRWVGCVDVGPSSLKKCILQRPWNQ